MERLMETKTFDITDAPKFVKDFFVEIYQHIHIKTEHIYYKVHADGDEVSRYFIDKGCRDKEKIRVNGWGS